MGEGGEVVCYKIHLIVDTTYEMPIGYRVTRASESDTTQLLPMVKEVRQKHRRFTKTWKGWRRIRGMTVRKTAETFMMSTGLSL